MKELNRIRLYKIEQKWENGTISQEEIDLYSRWYNWNQNAKVKIPSEIALSESLHKKKLFNNVLNELDAQGYHILFNYKKKNTQKKAFYAGLAAACVALFIFVGLKLLDYKSSKTLITKVEDVLPGKSGLILTLHNGSKVLIDSMPDGLIEAYRGLNIFKRDGKIVYEGSADPNIFNTATTAIGRKYQIILPDNSKVWLNASSEIRYPLAFNPLHRDVYLNGEAYFEIEHLEKKQPFIVHIADKTVKVLGTHFDVKSYDVNNAVTATLLQGSIEMQAGNTKKILTPNHAAISTKQTQNITLKEVNATNSILWINNKFSFYDNSLEDIMNQLERWYGVKIQYENGVDRTMVFAGSTPMNQNLSAVLKVLELSGLHFKYTNGILYVKK